MGPPQSSAPPGAGRAVTDRPGLFPLPHPPAPGRGGEPCGQARLRAEAGATLLISPEATGTSSPLPREDRPPGQGGAALWGGPAPLSAGHLSSPEVAGGRGSGSPAPGLQHSRAAGRSGAGAESTVPPRPWRRCVRRGARESRPADSSPSPLQPPHLRKNVRSRRRLSPQLHRKMEAVGPGGTRPAPGTGPAPARPTGPARRGQGRRARVPAGPRRAGRGSRW